MKKLIIAVALSIFATSIYTQEITDQIKAKDLEQKLALKQNRIIPVNHLQKQAVHVASVFYANFFIALADMSLEILKNSGVSFSEELPLFRPLILSAIENLTNSGPAGALTGPVSRADSETLKQHLGYLEKHHPGIKEAYRMLGKRLAKVSNLSKKEKKKIIDLLNLT